MNDNTVVSVLFRMLTLFLILRFQCLICTNYYRWDFLRFRCRQIKVYSSHLKSSLSHKAWMISVPLLLFSPISLHGRIAYPSKTRIQQQRETQVYNKQSTSFLFRLFIEHWPARFQCITDFRLTMLLPLTFFFHKIVLGLVDWPANACVCTSFHSSTVI